MTSEEIKRTWNEAAQRFYRPTPEEFEIMYREKKETALERLAERYRRFSRMGLLMIVMWILFSLSHVFTVGGPLKWIICALMIVYFALCSCIDHWLYKGVSSIDCFTMTVSEVASKALYYRKKHLQSMILLIPFAFLAVGLLAYSFKAEPFMIYGILAGMLVGVALGYNQFRRFMKEYSIVAND
ncbi:MAG: hypothetical protein K2M10_04755 [Muribaculaceae bacterium]|nr:hypothetical protein [Muribaculaceae bacterium]